MKNVPVNNSAAPVFLLLTPFCMNRSLRRLSEPTLSQISCLYKTKGEKTNKKKKKASTGTRGFSLLKYCRISSCPNEKLHESNLCCQHLKLCLCTFFLVDTEIDTDLGGGCLFLRFCKGWFCLSVKRFLCCIKYFKYL